MLNDFQSYVKEVVQIPPLSRVVLACSGGVDSMVLLHLLQLSDYPVMVVHVDHRTRAGKSTKDSGWLQDYCTSIGVPIKVYEYAHSGGNFQSKAAMYRYSILEEVANDHDIDYILTGHHADDRVEGFHQLLPRSVGLSHLVGMQPKQGKVCRPLLFTTKVRIEKYAEEQSLDFRLDASNASDDYDRNWLRHHIIPQLEQYYGNYVSNVSRSLDYLKNDLDLLNDLVSREWVRLGIHHPRYQVIDLAELRKIPQSVDLMAYALSNHAWSRDQLSNMLSATTGSTFRSPSHEALVDRGRLLLRPIEEPVRAMQVAVDGPGQYHYHDQCIEVLTEGKGILRSRQPGDRVYVAGHHRLLKKYLIDLKVNIWDKEQVVVLDRDTGIVEIVAGLPI